MSVDGLAAVEVGEDIARRLGAWERKAIAYLSRDYAMSTDGLWHRVPRCGPAVVDMFVELGIVERRGVGWGKVELTLTELGALVRHAVMRRTLPKADVLKECDDCAHSRAVRGTAYIPEGGVVWACDAPDAVPSRAEGFARCGAMRADEGRCGLAAGWFEAAERVCTPPVRAGARS